MPRREFHYSDAKSDKFWVIELQGASFTVQFGRTGTAGQTQLKEFDSEAKAQKAAEKLIQAKLKKGYEEVEGAFPVPKQEKEKKRAAPKKAAPKKAAPAEKGPGPDPHQRAIDLDPADWTLATWRQAGRVAVTEPVAFDQQDCCARLAKVRTKSYGWDWQWRQARIARALRREEAHFWLEAILSADREVKPKQLAAKLEKKRFDGKATLKATVARIKKNARAIQPEIVLPLVNLFSFEEVVGLLLDEKLMSTQWYVPRHFLDGFRRYLGPHLDDRQRAALNKKIKGQVKPANWPQDFYQPAPMAFQLAAAAGGFYKELTAAVGAWPDGLYGGEEWHDHYHRPQELIFGLGSAAEVEAAFRRLKLLLRTTDHIRAWLAHTELAALDVVRDSVAAVANKSDAAELLEAFCIVNAPEAAPHMLALKSSSKAPAVARRWLEEHPGQAVVGLLTTAAGRGKLAEQAVAHLREMKRRGYAELVAEEVAAAPGEVASKVRALVVEHEEKTYEPLDEAGAPAWLKKALKQVKAPKKGLPGWIDPATLPPVVVGERRLGDVQVEQLLFALRASELEQPHELLTALKDRADGPALDAFAWQVFSAWLEEGAPSKEKWALLALGHLGGDEAALKLTPEVRAWPGESQHQRAVLGLTCLRAIGSDTALMQLNGIAQKLKFKALKSRAVTYMEEIARQRGMTRAQLEDLIVPECDLDERGTRTFDFGPRSFTFALGPQMKPMVRDEAGKLKANLPKPGKKDDAELADRAVAEWKLLKKQVREVAKIQAVRLEQAMVTGRRWAVASFEKLLVRHPLMTNLVRLVLWGGYDARGKLKLTFRVTEEQQYADAGDEALELTGVECVGIVHPLHLDGALKGGWGQVFSDYEIAPPFLQLGRPIHGLEKGEPKHKEITRFKGPKIPSISLVSTLEKQGWNRGMPQDAGIFFEHSKPFESAGVTAVVQYDGIPIGDMVDWDDQQVETCFFLKGLVSPESWFDAKKSLALGKVDPVVISEVLSDLELLVSKAR